jgi:hypothetical protein
MRWRWPGGPVEATPERHEEMCELHVEHGWTPEQLAKRYGVGEQVIKHHLRARGVLRLKQTPNEAKRNLAMAEAVRDGATIASQARKYGISAPRVAVIVRKIEGQWAARKKREDYERRLAEVTIEDIATSKPPEWWAQDWTPEKQWKQIRREWWGDR